MVLAMKNKTYKTNNLTFPSHYLLPRALQNCKAQKSTDASSKCVQTCERSSKLGMGDLDSINRGLIFWPKKSALNRFFFL